MSSSPGTQVPPVQGVNVMLGGAMLSGIILVIFVICYYCHKNARKWESNLPTHTYCGRDWSLPLQIYTIQSTQYTLSDIPPCSVGTGPPPPYEAVVPITKNAAITNSTTQTSLCHHNEPVSTIRNNSISNDVSMMEQHNGLLQQISQRNNTIDYWNEIVEDDSGLPSYDAAVQQKMTAQHPQMHI